MKVLHIFLLISLIVVNPGLAAEPFVFPRTPAPSPDGSRVAFSFQ